MVNKTVFNSNDIIIYIILKNKNLFFNILTFVLETYNHLIAVIL